MGGEWGKYELLEQEDKIVGEPDPPMLVVKEGFVGKIEEAVITPEETILTRIDGKTFPLSMISFRAVPFTPGPGMPEYLQRFYPRLCDNFHVHPDINRAMLEKIIEMTKLAERGTELFDIVMKEIVVLRDAEKEVRQRKPWYEGGLWVSLLRAFDAKVSGFERDGCTLSFEKQDAGLIGLGSPEIVLDLDENKEMFVGYEEFKHFPLDCKKKLEQNPIGMPLFVVLYDCSRDPSSLGSKQKYIRVWPPTDYWYKTLMGQKRRVVSQILPALLLPINEIADLFKVPADAVHDMIARNAVERWGFRGQNKLSIEELVMATLNDIKREAPDSGEYCEDVPYLTKDSRTYNVPDLRGADRELVNIYYGEQVVDYMNMTHCYYTDYFKMRNIKISDEILMQGLENYARIFAECWTNMACGI